MSHLDFSLKKVEKNISEGKYKKIHKAEIDYLSKVINFGNKKLTINSSVFDPLSIIYKIRNNFKAENYPEILLDYLVDEDSISSKYRKQQVKNRIKIIIIISKI